MTGSVSEYRDVKDPFEEFDPNKGNAAMWGVYKDGRFKTYANRGHAINATLSARRTKMYEQTPEGWKLVAVKDQQNPPNACEVCGTEDVESTYGGNFVFERLRGKITDPLRLLYCCPECKYRVARS